MMVIYLPVKFDWSNRFQVRVRKRKMWTEGRRTHQSKRRVGYMQPP